MRNKTLQEKERDLQRIKYDLSDIKNIVLVNDANLGYQALKKLAEIMTDTKSCNVIKHQRLSDFLKRYKLSYEVTSQELRIYTR